MHDRLACGRRFRVLNILYGVTKVCRAAVADTSLAGKRVVREMTALIVRRIQEHGQASSDTRTSCFVYYCLNFV